MNKKIILFITLTFFSLFLVTEIVLRIFDVNFPPYYPKDAYPYDQAQFVDNPSWGVVIPNPIFGHVNNPQKATINNYGFKSPHDYPYERQKQDFIVGLYGGSVAEDNAEYLESELNNGEALKSLKSCGFNFVVLNLGSGAMKQPQQLHGMIHSLHWIDLAINLDGFNDLTLDFGFQNPVEYSHYYPDVFPKGLKRAFGEYFMYLSRLAQYSIIKMGVYFNNLNKLKLFSVSYWGGVKLFQGFYDYFDSVGELIPTVYHMDQPITKVPRFDLLKESYKRNTLYQSVLAKAQNIPLFVFNQPNQYLPNTKRFMNEIEKKIAINEHKHEAGEDPYRYKEILEISDELRGQGVNVIDLTKVFYEETGVVYRDDCCHYNEDGNKILAREIVNQISNSINEKISCQ